MSIIGKQKFDFKNLFIFEMANNHQGEVEHGRNIINAMSDIARQTNIRAAVKLQFRDLDTFIHPDHKSSVTNKHIPRFLSTRLTDENFGVLINEIKNKGLVSMCTPFDEPSVDKIVKFDIEVIKIGSPSAHDWPLLEKIAETGKPVICSVGGLTIKDIDKIVSFFQHRGVDFALMHCVGIYPTPVDKFHLNQIEVLLNRYPGIEIGFSTHEDPNYLAAIQLAYSKGARIYEKHVGVATDKITLNSYSANPAQILAWVNAWKEAVEICGHAGERQISPKEFDDLYNLKRGVYVKRNIPKGTPLRKEDVFFAMPISGGQLSSGEWKEYFVADHDYVMNEAVSRQVVDNHPLPRKYLIAHIVHELKGILNTAKVVVGSSPDLELSHHYGLERFREFGAAIIDCINREYCKKIIIQLPNQVHPNHHHIKKEEAFQLLYGELVVQLDGREKHLYPGDIMLIPRGAWHSFKTDSGAIFEEVSTTHFVDDSFYEDKSVNQLARDERKTKLINWGFHQFD